MNQTRLFFVSFAVFCVCVGLYVFSKNNFNDQGNQMIVTSTAFQSGGTIPKKYTCDGENIAPHIAWRGFPAQTKSFVLICDDPDAPQEEPFVHWVVYNIPAHITEFKHEADVAKAGALQGMTDFGASAWGGPCPPSGVHQYVFNVYALDTMLDVQPNPTKAAVVEAMQKHILAKGKLVGLYKRSK